MSGILRAIFRDILRLERPGRAIAHLPPFYDAEPCHAQRRHDAHIHDLRGGFKSDLAPLGSFALAVNRNAVMAAERADPRLGPAVASPCRLAGAIEEPRDLPVGHQARQLPDQRQSIFRYGPAMLAYSVHFYFQGGVAASIIAQLKQRIA